MQMTKPILTGKVSHDSQVPSMILWAFVPLPECKNVWDQVAEGWWSTCSGCGSLHGKKTEAAPLL